MAASTRSMALLRGPIFKVILKDADPNKRQQQSREDDTDANTTVIDPNTESINPMGSGTSGTTSQTYAHPTGSAGPPEYFIHKSLLSSLSTELYNHANNDMREGRENVIELGEVDEPTFESFVEWAYFEDYCRSVPLIDQSILAHTKVYVLAERFNITALKTLSYSKLSALFVNMGVSVPHLTETHVIEVTNAVTYAFDNLPLSGGATTRTTSTTSNPGPGAPTAPTINLEPLLKFFAQYISWALELLKHKDGVLKLLSDHPDLLKAVLFNCKPASSPPWATPATTTPKPATSAARKKPAIISAARKKPAIISAARKKPAIISAARKKPAIISATISPMYSARRNYDSDSSS